MAEIKFASHDDSRAIRKFIKQYWNEHHIFVESEDVFNYCHKDKEGISFVIAVEDEKICGICGYVKSNSCDAPDVWACLWKTINSYDPFLGIKIMRFLMTETHCRNFSCCGIVPKTFKLYEFLGCKTGKMEHWYWLNNLSDYSIARVTHNEFKKIHKDNSKLLVFDNWDELVKYVDPSSLSVHIPYKDNNYLKHRYFEHITYKYEAICLQDGNNKCLVIGRRIMQNNSVCFKITDVLGDEKVLCSSADDIIQWFVDRDFEYAYMYQYGIDKDILSKSGFILRTENDPNIIPNYFEPFLQENVDIYFSTLTTDDFRMFTGDGDQDRPNII